jgi:hypothetical protein
MKKWYQSKTMWVALATALFGVVESQFGLLKDVLSPSMYAYLFTLVGAVNAVLRTQTTEAIK